MSSAARARAAWVETHLRERCFGSYVAGTPLRFGAEMELLALDASTRRIAPIESPDGAGSLGVVRLAAEQLDWTEQRAPKGGSRFITSGGGALTFEPGGQIEYASAVHSSVDAVLAELRVVDGVLREHASMQGIELLARGVDPVNSLDDAPLQLDAPRYRRMDAYFAGIGADGARMMRQTASLQLCIGGIDLVTRWRLANSLAPWLVAIFANSSCYAGQPTGCASYRADTWRGVDPRRTGVFQGQDPVREYAAFALGAPAFLAGPEGSPALPFAAMIDGEATDDALATHLSTLFPEVRPRGYLELRSADAVDVRHHAAALVLAVGLLGDDAAARRASELIGEPAPALLRAAGRAGVAEPALTAHARELVETAMLGCVRLGEAIVSESTLADAHASFAELLARGVAAQARTTASH